MWGGCGEEKKAIWAGWGHFVENGGLCVALLVNPA